MVYNERTRFGEDSNGSALYFNATNISAKQVPGTLKQLAGYNLTERQVPMRNIQDWNIRVEGVMQDTKANIESFKTNMNALYGGIYVYEDGVSDHTGSYIMKPYSFEVDESADNYEGGRIFFSFDLCQFNQQQ